MNDMEIIEMYFRRDENAISQTEIKYGLFCRSLAYNILQIHEDAEECVNDTYLKAWNSIPPNEPVYFRGWLGRVVRNLSLDLWRKNHRKKRYAGIEEIFEELDECIPSSSHVEGEIEKGMLTEALNKWVGGLPQMDRIIFLRRYWFGESLKSIAKIYRLTPADVANRMYRLRQKLKAELKREGLFL